MLNFNLTIAIMSLDQSHHVFVAPCIASLEAENIFVRPQTTLVRLLQLKFFSLSIFGRKSRYRCDTVACMDILTERSTPD